MSREYTPDRWAILELGNSTQSIRKVFAGWYGGYLGSDSWKLSSGIVEAVEHDKYWEFKNHSGSVYKCYKSAEGMGGYMSMVYSSWLKEAETSPDLKIKIVSEEYV